MVSPVPRHLRTEAEVAGIPERLREHVSNLDVKAHDGCKIPGAGLHRAKYAPGLATQLVGLTASRWIGDPMAGVGTLAHETGLRVALNDIDPSMALFLGPLALRGCEVTFKPATEIPWRRDVCIFSPPYYPRADRLNPNAHDDDKRGPVVGFRDSYKCEHPLFIGNPAGADAVAIYRRQMTDVYGHVTDPRPERRGFSRRVW